MSRRQSRMAIYLELGFLARAFFPHHQLQVLGRHPPPPTHTHKLPAGVLWTRWAAEENPWGNLNIRGQGAEVWLEEAALPGGRDPGRPERL